MAKIMIVDDESAIRFSVRSLLESEGYVVKEAINADDCWEKIQQDIPDLILFDIRMPGTPAIEIIRRIKESPRLRKIRIVYMTAVIGAKEATKRLEGVIDAIEKPFKNEELIKIVNNALNKIIL